MLTQNISNLAGREGLIKCIFLSVSANESYFLLGISSRKCVMGIDKGSIMSKAIIVRVFSSSYIGISRDFRIDDNLSGSG